MMEVGIWMMIIFILKNMESKQYIRKLIREELNKPIVNKSFSLTMDDVEYIFEDWDLELLDEEERQRLKGHIIRFLQTNFSLDEKGMLKGIENFPEKITLYRLIFAKTKDDINVDKIGNHFVSDVDDFHDDMLDYLYYNAKRENKKIKKSDLWLIKIETQSNNIDFYETILTFSLHPNEDEITIKNDKLIKILSINKF